MVELGENLYIFGGTTGSFYEKEIHKLTCVAGSCSWTTLTQKLKVGRRSAVVIPVMDYFCTPNWVNKFLKVRQIRNDFFKPTFLPKNERTISTLLLVDLFSFVFWKKVKTPKRHFEINWPLNEMREVYHLCFSLFWQLPIELNLVVFFHLNRVPSTD